MNNVSWESFLQKLDLYFLTIQEKQNLKKV